MVISISSIEEEAVGTITIEVGEEVEVLAISHLIQFNSLLFNRNNPIPLLASSRLERPTCQIYGKLGHIAIDCYHKIDYAYQGKHPPTKLAAMATASNSCLAPDQPWLADSAATDHVSSSLNQLSFSKPYTGSDHLIVGNWSERTYYSYK